ncbi:hypothetical protein [Luteimonas saliphila]|uniref:hypothetical protein n=1 Tax=Luteimonas saliphila TaxID=2804919 RepID=UPI00192E2947|nr:hypothetical protein [Luteimonas saliphila]
MGIVFAKVPTVRIVRGTRWQDQVQLTDENTGEPVDLAGIVSLVMCIREQVDSPILLQLEVGSGLAIANPGLGLIDIDVSSADTLSFPENGHQRWKYSFDALIERTAGEYEAAFAGRVTVLPSITRTWDT